MEHKQDKTDEALNNARKKQIREMLPPFGLTEKEKWSIAITCWAVYGCIFLLFLSLIIGCIIAIFKSPYIHNLINTLLS